MRSTTRISAVVLGTALLVGACSSSGSDNGGGGGSGGNGSNGTALLTDTSSDRESKLVECAKKEGTLTWYTDLVTPTTDNAVKAFEAKYPFIKVDVFSAQSADLLTRMNQELIAHRVQADVVDAPLAVAVAMHEKGQTAPFYSPNAAKLDAKWKTDLDGDAQQLVVGRLTVLSFGYNTTLLDSSLEPKTLEDLANPGLKGKMAISSSDTGVHQMGNYLSALGEEKGTAFLEQLSHQDIKLEDLGGSQIDGMLASGQLTAVLTSYLNHDETLIKQQDAKIKWVPISPVTALIGSVFVQQGTDNPCGAALYADFLLGPDEADNLHSVYYNTPDQTFDYQIWSPVDASKPISDYEANFKKWTELFHRYLG